MTQAFFSLQKLPLISEFALVVLSAWLIAGWLLPQTDMQITTMMATIETTKTTTLPDINKIIAVTLFGKAPKQIQPKAAPVQQIQPIIRQPLTFILLGTVVAGDHSAAIISVGHGKGERAYFIHDYIQPGISLQNVEIDAITVDRNGVLERISLQQGEKLTSTSMPNPQPSSQSIYPSKPQSMNTNGQRRAMPPSPPITKQMNRKHLQQQLQNFPALLSQARALPHFVNGKMQGFTLTDIAPGSLYEQAGLRNNDIIMSINGEKITGAQQAMGIYSTLKNAQALDLELIRASGVTETIHYDIR